ncbi:Uu.00g045410.m01.CDS01 [Anthostomella pinea]|uniref:Uu.00g045410.m01.CDS01 n=1 Tax=Anthostomella pinea TaxID=933095 RepID=A0AAI8VB88_9PEZI|nr:Uu.00g045410.m01.CDS01 [Anthostomella pinea]
MLSATHIFLLLSLAIVLALTSSDAEQHPFQHGDVSNTGGGISIRLFASLERLSRLVDITYCVGTTGISQPFSCVSRCKDFPSLELVTTWNTGVLMSDSCGYIAVDHGTTSGLESTSHEGGDIGTYGKDEGAIIVAFRGTYSITNTVVDLSTVPQEYVPYPSPDDGGDEPPNEPEHRCQNCTVHMGFLASWQIARKEVLAALKPLHKQYPDYPIHLVGHSLGGAVSALASLELKVIFGWGKVVVTTFGEPRVGNDGFVEYLETVFELNNQTRPTDERAYRRVTHVDDPVPLLPLSEWGYRSHAGEFFISKSDLPPEPWDVRPCIGDYDPECIGGSTGENARVTRHARRAIRAEEEASITARGMWDIPTRYKLWELLFAHRDYFWRLGLCVPGGDPIDWDRNPYPNVTSNDEL